MDRSARQPKSRGGGAPAPVRSTGELAERLGLSRWTVSRALNGHSSVKPETARRVAEAAREAGFAPDLLGRGLRAGRTGMVGVCLPDLVDFYLTEKVVALQSALADRGWFPVFQIAGADRRHPGGERAAQLGERAALGRFAQMRPSAVILVASALRETDPAVESIGLGSAEVVWVDPLRRVEGRVVVTDRASAMREAAGHLFAAGHRCLAAVGFEATRAYATRRVAGIRAACVDAGVDFEGSVTFLPCAGGDDFASGFAAAAAFAGPRKIAATGVLALNDRIALGLVSGLRASGLSVPEDLSIVGYDNSGFAAHADPPLTSVDPCVPDLVCSTLSLLEPGSGPGRHSVCPRLVVRGSVCPPPSTRASRRGRNRR